jgi:Terminase small subunit.
MDRTCNSEQRRLFCRAFLQTMNPERAAAAARVKDGYVMLRDRTVQTRLEEMREAVGAQILREDAIRRLCELAFGRANDAVRLALSREEAGVEMEKLDLSAVAEFKATDKGGVEIKFIDRVRALEVLCGLLSGNSGNTGANEFFQALEEAGEQQ